MASETKLVNPIHPSLIDKMDPQFVEIYTKYQAPRLRADQVSIEEYRAKPTKYTFPIAEGPHPDVGSNIIYPVPVHAPPGETQVEVYHPTDDAISNGKLKSSAGLPCHIDYHGGGWVIGSLKSDDSWCRIACQELGMVIVNADYRLAPEHPFPTQVWDSWAALKWVHSNASQLGIDPKRISIGGLSAGGHIAAVLAILARDEPDFSPLKLQLLIVPAVDARWTPIESDYPEDDPYESHHQCAEAPCLPLNRMRWFTNLWLGTEPAKRKESAHSWLASPILAEKHAGLAPASIHSAEFDVLRDEGKAYHEKLQNAGTESQFKVYAGVAHPFGHWDGELEKGKEYVRDTIAVLRKAHAV